MNAIYKIIGEDGKEYGPATAGQVRQWIAEGRTERRTPIFVDGATDWSFVGLLPEFAACFATPTAIPPAIAPPPRGTSNAGRMAKTNSYALWGMIFGILSLVCCCCGFPFGLLGLVFSLIGLSQINANPELHEGRGMAIAGLILSGLSLLMSAGGMLFNLATIHPHTMWNVGRF
jgi:hypothetical protein